MPTQADINLAIDLGGHAAAEALRTLVEVTNRIPDTGIRVVALGVAFAVIEAKALGTRKVFGPALGAVIDECRDIIVGTSDPALDAMVAKAAGARAAQG